MFSSPLNIKTPNNINQPYHPSVIFIEEGFSGYKYWMAESPYPISIKPYRDRWETPCIHCSNDGKFWHELRDNPIDDLTELEIECKAYFSDPHLVLKEDCLECWYRLTTFNNLGSSRTYILRKTSRDGIRWSTRELLIDLFQSDKAFFFEKTIISPSIVYLNQTYYMWFVDKSGIEKNRSIRQIYSANGYKWSNSKICLLQGKYIDPWHIDVQFFDNIYYLLVYELEYNTITLWISKDGLNFNYNKEVLSPSHKFGSFYANGLYRACLVKNKKGFYIYFSCHNNKYSNIGLMFAQSDLNFKVVDGGTRITMTYKIIKDILKRIYSFIKRHYHN